MQIISQIRKSLKRILLGPVDFPQQCPVGMSQPQEEVAVWLHGVGPPRDVTFRHFMACGAPFTIGIGMNGDEPMSVSGYSKPSLQFRVRHGEQHLLGKIALEFLSQINAGSEALQLFRVRSYRNYCQPKLRLWGRYLLYAYQRAHAPNSDVPISARDARAMIVFYICPRPVVLVSARDAESTNIFPMNLMGDVGGNCFAFALNSKTPVSALVERSGLVALSSVPAEQTLVAFQLGKNHRKQSIDWSHLPFATAVSKQFSLPVPQFSLRVREMKIEAVHPLGSHTLFLARTIDDQHRADGLECHVVHGVYQVWRQNQLANLTLPHTPAEMSL